MKKPFLVFTIFSLSLISYAGFSQITRGTILAGGRFNYDYSRNAQRTGTSNLNVNPSAGIFVTPNFAVGTGLELLISSQKSPSNYEYKSKGLGFGPFARYYKFLGEKTALFGQASIYYRKTTGKYSSSDQDRSKTEDFVIALTPGLAYFVTPKIGLEASFGYIQYYKSSTKYINGTNPNPNSENSGFGAFFRLLNSAVGMNFYFNR